MATIYLPQDSGISRIWTDIGTYLPQDSRFSGIPRGIARVSGCRLRGEGFSEAGREGEHPDALDWDGVRVGRIELAAAFGVAEVEPVGSAVAGAGEAFLLDEGFQAMASVLG